MLGWAKMNDLRRTPGDMQEIDDSLDHLDVTYHLLTSSLQASVLRTQPVLLVQLNQPSAHPQPIPAVDSSAVRMLQHLQALALEGSAAPATTQAEGSAIPVAAFSGKSQQQEHLVQILLQPSARHPAHLPQVHLEASGPQRQL